MTKKEAAELLDLVVEKAPKLRAAGVRSVELGDLAFGLAPHEEPAPPPKNDDDEPPIDVLDDPMTRGHNTKPVKRGGR